QSRDTFVQVCSFFSLVYLFFQAEDGIRDRNVTGVQTCALSDLVPARTTRTRRPPHAAVELREGGRPRRRCERHSQSGCGAQVVRLGIPSHAVSSSVAESAATARASTRANSCCAAVTAPHQTRLVSTAPGGRRAACAATAGHRSSFSPR